VRHRRGIFGGALVGALVAGSLLVPSDAWAVWSASASGSGASAAAVMPTGATPSGSVGGTSVLVTWSAVALSNGTAVAGYVVNRYDATTDTKEVVGPGCSGVVATTSCTETSVPAGSWVYTDTPVEANWTGGESAKSATVTVP
jgi:hypothetical protein